ncbi:hypothetical protein EST38_g14115 [Candolleomyces aberdarensis]|uniref:CHAT domain-containing protein n=1 Tax=Candolleomyces aberdarensis TaxID=2316362 RepID=A0A4Q2CY43_9AGAR|nr:hypothetical protein EST38_g14115 [Candolleomyces aberdarensis]
MLSNLGILFTKRFECTGALSDIAESIAATQKAVNLAPADHPDLPGLLINLGNSFLSRFERTSAPSDIGEVIVATQRVVELLPAGHPDLPAILGNLGIWFTRRFECTCALSDVDESISATQQAVNLSPADHPDLPDMLINLAGSLLSRFEHTETLSDIDESISANQQAVELTPSGHPNLPMMLRKLGVSFTERFKCTAVLSDIDESIAARRKAVELTPVGDPELPCILINLGDSFLRRFERTGTLSDIDELISATRRAVELTPAGHSDLLDTLIHLGSSLTRRFKLTGALFDIDESISTAQRAVKLTPSESPDLPSRLNILGESFRRRFEHTGALCDIAESISATQQAVELTPHGHPSLPFMLNDLGSSFAARFECTRALSDIDESISAKQQAVKLTPTNHPTLPEILSNLGRSFTRRFEHTGVISDIAESILITQQAVELTPAGHPHLPVILANLGASFALRFELTSVIDDNAESISATRQAIELTPAGDLAHPARLNNLGISLTARFRRTGALSEIDESISATRKAVELTVAGHPHLPGSLNNLGISYSRRFERTGVLSDIDESISATRHAVELTPAGHPDLRDMLSNLGSALAHRFDRTNDLSDIAESISATQQAVELIPAGHPDLAAALTNLGDSFWQRSVLTGSCDDLNTSILHHMSAATCSYSPPSHRLRAANRWAQLVYKHHPDSPENILVFDTAIRLVSLVAGLDQTVQHRHTLLQGTSGLPCQAAAVGCSLGRANKALEWLEQSRCLVWSQLRNLRTQVIGLRTHDEDLAQRVWDVSRRLENAGSRQGSHIGASLSEKISAENEAQAHLKLGKEWDELLNTIRNTVPGFENFLQPTPCSSLLQHLPDSGPIVVINVHKDRCDAIALIAGLDEPLHIPLHSFSQQKANTYSNDLNAYLQLKELRMRMVKADTDEGENTGNEQAGRAIRPSVNKKLRNKVVRNILEALWGEVVKPILDALGFSSSSEAALPRIWWCPTGPMTFLPLHAAGIYGGRDSDSILNYAVSSYTPSITLLTDRVKNDRPIDQDVSGLFLTSQPNVPGLSSIPGTAKEARSIHKEAVGHGVRVLSLEGSDVTIDIALEHMEKFSSIHLACHASQNQNEPLQSRFLFHSGSLELSTIIRKNLKNADLAFLSACETSTGEERLSEEVVHLAAGMLAAGYRRVVATMWAIGDKHAPDVATDFYDYLLAQRVEADGSGFDGSKSAYALHHAIQQLRQRLDNSEKSLLAWIPYVHFGF